MRRRLSSFLFKNVTEMMRMERFDGWSARYCGDALAMPGTALAHFRTKGSKNGVRRYQQPDGTWTPLGLRLRKAREGWGETRAERKLARAKAKTQRIKAKEATQTKILREKEKVRAEKEKIKAERKKSRMARIEERRKNSLSKMTDAELQKKIERAKMEAEYKELTKSPVIKTGERLVTAYFDARSKRFDRQAAKAKMELESARVNADIVRAKEGTKRAKQEAKKAQQEAVKMREDRKAGLKNERKATLLKAKTDWRGGTLLGGIKRRINDQLTAGVKDAYKNKRVKLGEDRVKQILKGRQDRRDAQAKREQERARRVELQEYGQMMARQGRYGPASYNYERPLSRKEKRQAKRNARRNNS